MYGEPLLSFTRVWMNMGLLVFFFLAPCPAGDRGTPIEDKARSVSRSIRISSDAPGPEQFAVKELQTHFAILRGNTTVKSSDAGLTIHVGKGFLPDAANKALEMVRDDGFVLYRDGNNVYVAGNIPRGTLFGCYRYLESLGIRWPGPGLPAEVTSRTFDLQTHPQDGVDNPDFPVRGNNCYFPTNDRDFRSTLETVEWLTRQRYNLHSFLRQDSPVLRGFDDRWRKLADFVHQRGLEFVLGTHLSWTGLLLYDDQHLFRKHPEYFPLQKNGERRSPGAYGPDAVAARTGSGISVCVSNPAVVELITKNLRRFLDEHPEIDVVGMWPPDTQWEGCYCPGCCELVAPERMWSHPPVYGYQRRVTTDQMLHLIGEIAARINETHPKVRILTWAWQTSWPAPQNVTPRGRIQVDYFLPPSYTHIPSDNASDSCGECPPHNTRLENWHKWAAVKNVDFGWIFLGAVHRVSVVDFPMTWLLTKNLKFLHRIGAKAASYNLEINAPDEGPIRGDQTDHYLFCTSGVNYYALGRCAWDVDIPAEQLYAEFAEARFGTQAAPAITKYYTQIIPQYERWQRSQPTGTVNCGAMRPVRLHEVWDVAVDLFSQAMIVRARALLDQAESAASNSVHKERIRLERKVFEHTVLIRQIYHLHLARRELEQINDRRTSQSLYQNQLKLFERAEKIDLPKNYSRGNLDRQGTMWFK